MYSDRDKHRGIFIDIDGTLTFDRLKPWGQPRLDQIDKVKRLIAEGKFVVVWSAGGAVYAKAFCEKYELQCLSMGKSLVIIDDNSPNFNRIFPRIQLYNQDQFLDVDL